MGALARSVAIILLLAFTDTAKAAGPSCPHASHIVALSDILLAHPEKYGQENRIPTVEFAYLKIKYGSLGEEEALQLLSSLSGGVSDKSFRQIDMLEELRISLLSAEKRLAFVKARTPGDKESAYFFTFSAALARALMKDGQLSAFLSAIKADPKLATDAKSVPLILAIAGASLADSEKLPVAKQLDEFGYPDVAAAILASKDDIDDWIAYRRSHPLPGADTQSLFESFVSDTGPMLRHRGLSGLTQKLSIPPAGDISSAFDLAVLQSHRLAPLGGWVIQLFARGAPITLNAALFRQIDEGSLDPSNLDDLTIAITKELDKAFGNAKRQQITARQVVPLQIVSREGNGFPAEMWIDIALARRALSPLLLDHAAEPPSKPQAFGANPSWETWVAVAKALQQGKQPPEGFFTPYIEAELLAAAGRSNEAIAILSALARKGDNYGATTAFATKFLVSLLRRCDDEMRSASLTSIHVFRLGEP